MKCSIWQSILLGLLTVNSCLAQDKDAAEAWPKAEVGRPGRGVGNFGLGVGVDPIKYTKAELLKIAGIQEELGLSDQKLSKLKEAQAECKQEEARIYQRYQDETARLKQAGDREAELAYRRATLAHAGKLTREFERPLLKVLDPKQLKRLEQIQIRADGYGAFSIPEVTDRLGLSTDQEAAIAGCLKAGRTQALLAARSYREASTAAAELPADGQPARLNSADFLATATKAQAAVVEARSGTLREIRKVLTNAQQATFRNMVGPPFDFNKLSPIKGIKPAATRPDEI